MSLPFIHRSKTDRLHTYSVAVRSVTLENQEKTLEVLMDSMVPSYLILYPLSLQALRDHHTERMSSDTNNIIFIFLLCDHVIVQKVTLNATTITTHNHDSVVHHTAFQFQVRLTSVQR